MNEELCSKCASPWNVSPCPGCDTCHAPAHWSIQNYEGDALSPTVRWFACGRHVHSILLNGRWDMDAVQVQHIEHPMQEVTS